VLFLVNLHPQWNAKHTISKDGNVNWSDPFRFVLQLSRKKQVRWTDPQWFIMLWNWCSCLVSYALSLISSIVHMILFLLNIVRERNYPQFWTLLWFRYVSNNNFSKISLSFLLKSLFTWISWLNLLRVILESVIKWDEFHSSLMICSFYCR